MNEYSRIKKKKLEQRLATIRVGAKDTSNAEAAVQAVLDSLEDDKEKLIYLFSGYHPHWKRPVRMVVYELKPASRELQDESD